MANEPSRKDSSRNNAPKQDKPQTSNVGWYLLVAVVLLFVVLAVAGNEAGSREEVKLSDFITGLRSGTYGPQNAHEVTFTQTGLNFQSRSNEQLREEKTLEVDRFVVPLVGIDDQTKNKLTDLLDEKDVTYAGGKVQSDWLSIIYFLIIPVLFLIFFIYLLRRMGGAGSA
ncbi:MAG: hypothetical protein AB8G99_04555, partial [Planctomycetaceae bacterium]